MAAAIAVLLAVGLGPGAVVTAIMVSSLPALALRAPNSIVLERELRYRPLVTAEVTEVVAYNLFAIGAVIAGLGVYGVASATVLKTMVGLVVLVQLGPLGLVRPRWDLERVRRIIGFGIRFQGSQFVNIVRDQGINLATGAIAGLSTLGLWAVAGRVLQVVALVLESLWRVSFPAMSRLMDAGEDASSAVRVTLSTGTVLIGGLLAVLAGSSPAALPVLLGPDWRPAADALPAACLGLAIAGPISISATGFLLAVGDASAVLRSVVLQTLATFLVALPLLSSLGLVALGLGALAGAIVDAVVLRRAVKLHLDVPFFGPTALPVGIAAMAGAVGWWIATSGPASIVLLVASVAAAILLHLGGLLLLRREATQQAWRVLAGTWAAARQGARA
jgi:O-antigen/teichoic acid export membrane protein